MNQVTDFGMFSDMGNLAVLSIVEGAISNDLPWLEVYQCLVNLSEQPGFEEATDTMVREMVYNAIFGEYENDGQPDEAQEWFDFDPEC